MNLTTGKCPGCGKLLTKVKTNNIGLQLADNREIHGLSYECPYCHVIISVQYDPTSHTHDITSALGKR